MCVCVCVCACTCVCVYVCARILTYHIHSTCSSQLCAPALIKFPPIFSCTAWTLGLHTAELCVTTAQTGKPLSEIIDLRGTFSMNINSVYEDQIPENRDSERL